MEIRLLGSLVERKIGYGIVQPGQSIDGGVPVIKVNNLITGLTSVKDLDTTSTETAAKYSRTKLKGGELIVSVVGTIGKTAIVPAAFAGCNLVRATALIDIPEQWLSYWVKYYIDSPAGQAYIDQNLNTTVQPTLNIKSLVEMPIPFFDETLMKRAVAFLKTIDDKIATNNRINDNLEYQASALVEQYFESVSSIVPFAEIMSFENGFAFQSSTYLPSGQYRIITIKNVQDGQIDTTGAACIDELPQRMKEGCVLQIGDALLSLTGNVGRVGIVCENGLLLNQRVAKIVPHRKELLPLLYFIYRQPSTKTQLESIAKGTAQLNLSPVETLKLTVPYNSEVALNLSHTLTPIYQAIIANNQQSIILASMRDALLPKLMSGEIDVTGIWI